MSDKDMKKNESAVSLRSLDAGYHGKPVVEGVDLDIAKGEVVVLIGPNGAGKSTMLKSIVRQLPVVGGKIMIADRNLMSYSYADLSKTMAVVLTDRIRPELMTCRDVVAAGRYPYTGRMGRLTPEDEKKVDEALREVHAEEIEDRDFSAVSDGQRQRIMLARALCQEPDVLVLDEPTSFLDVRYKLEFLTICRRMAKERKITVIMSLHEIDLAMKIADRIVCVDGHHQVRAGTPEEIFSEEKIRELFEIDSGSFDPMFGSVELAPPKGDPEVFVISACGTGIPVYRSLQKERIPFAAGILYTNDVDYRLARLLATEVITEEPFRELSDAALDRARAVMARCRSVINVCDTFGPDNQKLRELIDEARADGKLEGRRST